MPSLASSSLRSRALAAVLGLALRAACVAGSACSQGPAACFRARQAAAAIATPYELATVPDALPLAHSALPPGVSTSAFLGTDFSLVVDIVIVVGGALVLSLLCWTAYCCSHREKEMPSQGTLGELASAEQAKQRQMRMQAQAQQLQLTQAQAQAYAKQQPYAPVVVPPPLALEQQGLKPPPLQMQQQQAQHSPRPMLPLQYPRAPAPSETTAAAGVDTAYHPTALPSHSLAPHPLQASPVDMHISPGLQPNQQVVYTQPPPGTAQQANPYAPGQAQNYSPYAPPLPPPPPPATLPTAAKVPPPPPQPQQPPQRPPAVVPMCLHALPHARALRAAPVNKPPRHVGPSSVHVQLEPEADSGAAAHDGLDRDAQIPIISEFGLIAPGWRNQHGMTQERTLGNWTRDSN